MPDEQPFSRFTLTARSLAASRGGRAVFRGVSFALSGGNLLAVVGPNGAGKSTLLRLIAGLLRPVDGEIALAPADSEGRSYAHYVGHLDALKGGLSLTQNLLFWARLWGSDVHAVEAALETVGLGALGYLPVAVLSAGQKKRASLARLLIARRPVWLLDEPTASIDAAASAMLGGVIAAHLALGGIAVIATHTPLPVKPTHELTLGAA